LLHGFSDSSWDFPNNNDSDAVEERFSGPVSTSLPPRTEPSSNYVSRQRLLMAPEQQSVIATATHHRCHQHCTQLCHPCYLRLAQLCFLPSTVFFSTWLRIGALCLLDCTDVPATPALQRDGAIAVIYALEGLPLTNLLCRRGNGSMCQGRAPTAIKGPE